MIKSSVLTHEFYVVYINLPIGAVGAILMVFIPIGDGTHRKKISSTDANQSKFRAVLNDFDLSGFVLFAGFSIMTLLALEWGGTKFAWSSATIIGLFVGGVSAFIAFAAYEYHVGDGAMIPWYMVKKTVVWSSCVSVFFFFGALMLYSYYMPIYFQAVRGVSPALSGVYVLPGILGQMSTAVICGLLCMSHPAYLLETKTTTNHISK